MHKSIRLKSSHVIIDSGIANKLFHQNPSVFISYNEHQQSLLVSPKTNEWFPKLHKTKEYILKEKDMYGTKSISIRDLLLDHNLDEYDRSLNFELSPQKNFLKIRLQ